MSKTRIAARFAVFVLVAGVGVATGQSSTNPNALAYQNVGVDPIRVSDRAFSLVLVGDAGEPVEDVAPIFAAIAREAADLPRRAAVVVLGDNVYPRGLPAEGSPSWDEAYARLEGQVLALKKSGARAVFVPGNHDWDRDGAAGWDAIRRQAKYVEQIGAPEVRFRPLGGCPGPAVEDDLVPGLRIVAIDTQWWLHPAAKPINPGSDCPAATDAEVQAALRAALVPPDGRTVVVVSHHPPVSGGGHGGHFTARDHLFPLRAWKGWLWIPLPGIGSLVPLGRGTGMFRQDSPAKAYAHMLSVVAPILRERPPLAWAAGHEHGVQLLEGEGLAKRLIVSGAGAFHHTRTPKSLPTTRFASGEPGFVRLDIDTRGQGRLAAIAVRESGASVERYSERIDQ